jgi:hypothetical protein
LNAIYAFIRALRINAFCTDSSCLIELQWRRSIQQGKMIEQAYLNTGSRIVGE